MASTNRQCHGEYISNVCMCCSDVVRRSDRFSADVLSVSVLRPSQPLETITRHRGTIAGVCETRSTHHPRASQIPCTHRLKYLWLLLGSTHWLFPACRVLFIQLSAKAACGHALTVQHISGARDSSSINGTVFYLLQSAL